MFNYRLTGDVACSPQSGHSSSTCGSPPATASTANQVASASDPLTTATATSCITSTHLPSSWSILSEAATGEGKFEASFYYFNLVRMNGF